MSTSDSSKLPDNYLAPIPLAGGAGRSHLSLLLALLQLLSGQHDLTGVITATWAIPETVRYVEKRSSLAQHINNTDSWSSF